jgi:glycosyltransferase involved in cell wall biosynthesis
MKILHLANHCHRIGNGIMNVAVDTACEQAAMGHQVAFASAGGSFVELLQARGVAHHEIWQYWRRPRRLPGGVLRLRRLLSELQPDVVHAHMMSGALLARAMQRGYALVTSIHNDFQRSSSVMRVGDRVIAVSDATRQAMLARGLSDRQLRTVRNGPLGSPRSGLRNGESPRLERPAILTVCGLYRRKGVSELIEAFANLSDKHPAARLYIAGDGPDRDLFQEQARRTHVSERIVFLGFAPNPAPLFAQADIFVLASHAEPFGLVIAEAREAGCAIVGSDTGGIPEVLEFGEAGLLTPPGDAAALTQVLDRLLGDAGFRANYQRKARQNLHWLSCARMAEETVAVYREAIEEARRRRGSATLRWSRLLARVR